MTRTLQGKFDYALTRYLYGLPLRQHPRLQDVRQPGGEVSADPEPASGGRRRRRTSPGAPWRGTSPPRRHHLLPAAVRFQRGQSAAPTSPRARFCLWPPAPSAASAFSPFREMGRFYRHVLMAKRYPHHGAVAFAHCGKTHVRGLPATWVWRILPTTSPPPSRIPGRIPSPADFQRAWGELKTGLELSPPLFFQDCNWDAFA